MKCVSEYYGWTIGTLGSIMAIFSRKAWER
jgi:hypothetical protein